MKRVLFPLSSTLIIMACSLSPVAISDDAEDRPVVEYGAMEKEELNNLPLPAAKPMPTQHRHGKIARYSNPCSTINTGDLKTDIMAKLDCLAELRQ